MPITLRPPTPGDVEPCGRIVFDAFQGIATRHNFPLDFPTVEHATGLVAMLIGSPAEFGVVAEQDGRIVGSNFLLEADAIRGVGPISVDPTLQGSGVGRRLMEAVIERGRDAPGIRLVQDAFNSTSMSLYSSLGFEVKEPLVMIQGRPKNAGRVLPGLTVRPMQKSDLAACNALCQRLHGFDRGNELGHAPDPWVVVRDGRVTAYATTFGFWAMAHGVAESEEDMRGLILGVSGARTEPVWFLLPTRQAGFFGWCLSEKLRIIKPMTLMAMGTYQEAISGCWFPSVFY